MQQAHANGLNVIIKEGLANGRLTGRNSNPAFANQLKILQRTADELECTIDALALAACLDRPWATTVLSGAACTEHLMSNVKAMDVVWDQKSDQELESLVETPAQYWTTRSELPWN